MASELSRLVKIQPFVRNREAEDLLELFFVTAVSSIIIVRFFLYLTGYPQLGGSGLHIAHVLPGGLLMMVSLVLLFSFLNRGTKFVAAVLGGIGFGLFLDELGKFLTSDTNYFFEPTIMLIYLIFIGLFFTFRALGTIRRLSQRDNLVNALELTKDAAIHDLDEDERRRVLQYLSEADPTDPLVRTLRRIITALKPREDSPDLVTRTRERLGRFYQWLIGQRYFGSGLVAFYVIGSALVLYRSLAGVRFDDLSFTFVDWGRLIPSTASAVLVVIGAVFFFRSRRLGYELFRASLLISIFLTQLFIFYQDQLGGIGVLVGSLVGLGVVQYLLDQEHRLGRRD